MANSRRYRYKQELTDSFFLAFFLDLVAASLGFVTAVVFFVLDLDVAVVVAFVAAASFFFGFAFDTFFCLFSDAFVASTTAERLDRRRTAAAEGLD